MLKVLKFGGSSLADANQFKKVAEIIKSENSRRYIVASAPGKRNSSDTKVTDMLLTCFKLASEKNPIDDIFEKITSRYNGIIADLGLDLNLEEDFAKIKFAILNHVGSDYVASRGEYLNSRILAAYLGFDFVDAADGVFFKDNGTFDAEKTNAALKDMLQYHEYAVIPGFYGSMPNGTIKTFSRGGSDITGSIVARAVEADLYENWTDTSGMLMADPRIVDDPKPIAEITYTELRELSYMGASVFHEDAISPVKKADIPINIRNTNRPDDKGTLIVPKSNVVSEHIITGVVGRKGFTAIFVEKDMMNSEVGFGRKVLEVIEKHGVCFEHLPSGIDTMSVVVSSKDIKEIKGNITAELVKAVDPDSITLFENLALVAVVGRGMIRTEGTAMRTFKALADAHVNVRMIDQGSSELNIIIGIEEKDYETAIKAIYAEFVKSNN